AERRRRGVRGDRGLHPRERADRRRGAGHHDGVGDTRDPRPIPLRRDADPADERHMPKRPRALILLVLVLALALPAGQASAAGSSGVAALQVALQARLLYVGLIDGVAGPDTKTAVLAFQRRKGLLADGVVGARPRAALGRYG